MASALSPTSWTNHLPKSDRGASVSSMNSHLAVREQSRGPLQLDRRPVLCLYLLGLPDLDAFDRGICEGPLECGRAADLGGLADPAKELFAHGLPEHELTGGGVVLREQGCPRVAHLRDERHVTRVPAELVD